MHSIESGPADPNPLKDLQQREKKLSKMLGEAQKKLEAERKERTSILSHAQEHVIEINSLKKELGMPYKYSSASDVVTGLGHLFANSSTVDVMDCSAVILPTMLHSCHLPFLLTEFNTKLFAGLALSKNVARLVASLENTSITPAAEKLGTIMSVLQQSRWPKDICKAYTLNMQAKGAIFKDCCSEWDRLASFWIPALARSPMH